MADASCSGWLGAPGHRRPWIQPVANDLLRDERVSWTLDDLLEPPSCDALFIHPPVLEETREPHLPAALGLEMRLLLPTLLDFGWRLQLAFPEGGWCVHGAWDHQGL